MILLTNIESQHSSLNLIIGEPKIRNILTIVLSTVHIIEQDVQFVLFLFSKDEGFFVLQNSSPLVCSSLGSRSRSEEVLTDSLDFVSISAGGTDEEGTSVMLVGQDVDVLTPLS